MRTPRTHAMDTDDAPNPVRKLLLWDIDGTLFFGDRVGQHALVSALRRVFGIEGAMHGVETAGRTELQIAEELLRSNGIEPTTETIHAFFEGYLLTLEAELPKRAARLLPGVLPALQAVHDRPDLTQGLLTGNLARAARLKLEPFDAFHFFPFGAFGDDATHRNDLGHHALRRAHQHHRVAFEPTSTFVIGDTPRDIECGRAIGAHTIAVATGGYSIEALAAHAPTAVLSDLSDTAAFLKVIDAFPR